jgi:4-hydroxybutyrate CoA-transferase
MSWIEEYHRKTVSADESVKVVQSGNRVLLQAGCGVPQALEAALVRRAPELRDVEICHMHSGGKAEYVKAEYQGHFRHNAFFMATNTRSAVNSGRADVTPVWLSDIPGLLRDGLLPVDVAMVHLSPPDEHGFCSFGVSVDIAKPGAETAKTVIAQVNDQMPRTLGDSFIHVSKLKYVVQVSEPIITHEPPRQSEVQRQIGRHVADLVEDGSTLQLGIGGIPDAALSFMGNKRDLGVHTEMFSDGVMELIEAGVITNEKKGIHKGKVIACFIMGTRKLYDYVNNNPVIEMHPVDYTNDPFIISRNEKVVSINSAIQVDLTGQVCADSIGHNFFSGPGGQVDFVIGASRSKGGKSIIALPSTASIGKLSRIVPALNRGAGVVTTRSQVHYIVTEYGAAYLKGKTIRQRAQALIGIAHPDFREELTRFAREQHYLAEELVPTP